MQQVIEKVNELILRKRCYSRAGAPLKVAVTNVGSIVKSWQKHFLEDTSAKVNYWETDQ